MHLCKRALARICHTVGGEGRDPAKFRVQPCQIRAQPCVLTVGIIKELGKHAVMIAQKHLPILAPRDARAQVFDHPGRVRAAIDQIPQMQDLTCAVIGHINGDEGMNLTQKLQMAVNITNGIAVHGTSPLVGMVRPEY